MAQPPAAGPSEGMLDRIGTAGAEVRLGGETELVCGSGTASIEAGFGDGTATWSPMRERGPELELPLDKSNDRAGSTLLAFFAAGVGSEREALADG